MMNRKEKKICFICSSGGHFSELSRLDVIAKEFPSFLVLEKTENIKTDFCEQIYFVNQINRKEKFFVFKFFLLCLKTIVIYLKERPSHIVTTGALCVYPMVKIAKFFRKKIIYIESYARVYDLSTTGKKLYKTADLFLVQWSNLIEKYPRAKYVGNVFGE